MTVRAQAEQGGINYGSLRRRNSELGIRSEVTRRREIIAPLVNRGTPSEIREYLALHHDIEVTTNAVKKVVARIRGKQKRK